MPSELSQIILAKDVFLSSRSWEDVNAVLSVFNLAFGACSCQKRSPILRRRGTAKLKCIGMLDQGFHPADLLVPAILRREK